MSSTSTVRTDACLKESDADDHTDFPQGTSSGIQSSASYRLFHRYVQYDGPADRSTGSRRFLCAEVDDKIDCTPPDHAQLFAQLKAELAGGERYWFSEEEEKEIQHSNRNFYKMPAEQELFLRCFRMPQEGELSKPYTTTDLFNYLQKHYPAAMRGVTPNRLGRMMVALGIQRVHTEYGNVYRLVKLKDSSAA